MTAKAKTKKATKKTTKKKSAPKKSTEFEVVEGLDRVVWHNPYIEEDELYQVKSKGSEFLIWDPANEMYLNKGKPFTTRPKIDEVVNMISRFAAARN